MSFVPFINDIVIILLHLWNHNRQGQGQDKDIIGKDKDILDKDIIGKDKDKIRT